MSTLISSGQIIIFHQPRFPWNKGTSLTKPPFGVRSCEVAIIWPDIMPSDLVCLSFAQLFFLDEAAVHGSHLHLQTLILTHAEVAPVLTLKHLPQAENWKHCCTGKKHPADLCQFPAFPFDLPFFFPLSLPFPFNQSPFTTACLPYSLSFLPCFPFWYCYLFGQPRLSRNLPCLKEDSKLSAFLAALVVHLNFFSRMWK